MQELGGDIVLDDLVLEDAETRLLDRQRGQFRGGPYPCAHHRLDDRIDLLLVELAKLPGCLGRRLDEGVESRCRRCSTNAGASRGGGGMSLRSGRMIAFSTRQGLNGSKNEQMLRRRPRCEVR